MAKPPPMTPKELEEYQRQRDLAAYTLIGSRIGQRRSRDVVVENCKGQNSHDWVQGDGNPHNWARTRR